MNLQPGDIVTGPIFSKPVKILVCKTISPELTKIEAVGLHSKRCYGPVLGPADLSMLTKSSEQHLEFTGEAENIFLFLEDTRIRNAFQFDPFVTVK